MSRSYIKRTYHGITTAETEKQDKRLNNRRLRRQVNQRLTQDQDPDILPELKEVSNRWSMDKDGKIYDPDMGRRK